MTLLSNTLGSYPLYETNVHSVLIIANKGALGLVTVASIRSKRPHLSTPNWHALSEQQSLDAGKRGHHGT
jgi:hypothetical protein